MSKVTGFAIIGCGVIGPTHANSIKSIEGAKLVACADIVEERAKKMAAEHGCEYYTDYSEMLKRTDVDIVDVCVPSGLHSKVGIDVARAGKHVIVEKPIDVSLEAADSLIKACKDAGVKLGCISQHRYDPDIAKLKKAVDEGKLGQLNFGGSHTKWYRSQGYYDSGDWRGTWELDGGGALMNQSVHYVDMLQYIMGPVDEVFAYCVTRAHERIEVEDIAVATVKFKSGAVGLLEGNTAAFPGFCTRLDIYGSDGSVIIENDRIKEWKLRSEGIEAGAYGGAIESEKSETEKSGASTPDIFGDSHTRQIKGFLEAVVNDTEPPTTGEDARHPLAIILAVYESARTGKPVKVK